MNILRRPTLIVVATSSLIAQTAPLHVLASNGMKAVILELQPKELQPNASIEFGTTTALKQKIESGAPFDIAILTSDAIADLVKENKLAAATRADLARTGIGLAVRVGAPKPDIATSDALRKTLLAAPSITYAGDGASRPHLDRMFDRLGITAQVKPRLILTQGSGPAMQSVAAGKVAIVLTLISELKMVPGIAIVGPLPAELQSYVGFAVGVSTRSNHAEAARALIALLTGPAAGPVYAAKGMESVPNGAPMNHR